MPTIRVDDEVYTWLQEQATPFEDNPNSVLRRVARLDAPAEEIDLFEDTGNRRVTGRLLNKKWGVQAEHALYHREGTFYENLSRFPGALFDSSGYVVFESEAEYRASTHLRVGEKLNVPGGISSIPGYVEAVSSRKLGS
jgi:hypothetical protein